MKQTDELLNKCAQYEQLATTAAPPVVPHVTPMPHVAPMPHVTPVPRGMGVHPSGLVLPERFIPKYEPVAPKVAPEALAPKTEPTAPKTEPTAPKEAPKPNTVLDPKTLQPVPETALEIKFNEHGEVIVPDKWVGADGKLTVNKKQLAEAIHKARKAQIVRMKLDATKAKNLGKEMARVNSMVKNIALRESLTSWKGKLALLTVASLSVAAYIFANKAPTSTDKTKSEVIKQSFGMASSLDRPAPAEMQSQISALSTALSAVPTKSDKAKSVMQGYSGLLSNLNKSMQKLGGNLSLDNAQSAASYAAEIQNFERLAVEASPKLARLAGVFSKQGNNELAQQVTKVQSGLDSYVTAIESARAIKSQGVG